MAAPAMLLLPRANPIPLPFSMAPQASITWSSSAAARCSSLKLSAVQFQQPLRSDSDPWGAPDGLATTDDADEEQQQHDQEELEPETERKSISGIHVPRQRYIAVPKAALLDAIVPLFFDEDAAAEFKRFARCLDAFIHAEHKQMLEEMRTYYMLAKQQQEEEEEEDQAAVVNGKTTGLFGITQEDGTLFLTRSLGLRTLLGLSPDPDSQTRVAFATQFQRSFLNLLRNAQFEELSAQDLLLTYALNTDYLLTLPIYVDWKKAAESNAIIFRRGYATERQKGLLLVEKLDYLQSKLLQRIFFSLSKPLKKPGKWLKEFMAGTEKINREPGISDMDRQIKTLA